MRRKENVALMNFYLFYVKKFREQLFGFLAIFVSDFLAFSWTTFQQCTVGTDLVGGALHQFWMQLLYRSEFFLSGFPFTSAKAIFAIVKFALKLFSFILIRISHTWFSYIQSKLKKKYHIHREKKKKKRINYQVSQSMLGIDPECSHFECSTQHKILDLPWRSRYVRMRCSFITPCHVTQ